MQRIIARLITPNKEIQQSTNRKVDSVFSASCQRHVRFDRCRNIHRRGLASGLGTLHQPTPKNTSAGGIEHITIWSKDSEVVSKPSNGLLFPCFEQELNTAVLI